MLRGILIYLSRRRSLQRLIMQFGFTRRAALRFVAGETLDDAVRTVRSLNQKRIHATLDHLGENVTGAAAAAAAADAYLETLDAIARHGLDSNISVKLTQMGLDLSEDLCLENMARLVERANNYGNFVRIDMESSAYLDRTLAIFRRLYSRHQNVGVVIQAYLYRCKADVEEMIRIGARVRLCKGAYAEPPSIAFPRKLDVDRNYAMLAEQLLTKGNYPAIATHDETLIAHCREFAARHDILPSRFEFQMLYGIRPELQTALVAQGHNVRVYVPFGREWYAYLMRRLAERPANLLFLLSNVFRK